MLKSAKIKIACGISAAAAMMMPTAAMATGPASYSPMVALSMVAAPQSQAALCATGTAGATAAAEAATTAQGQPVQGCVLPVPDAAAPLPPQQAVLPPQPSGFSPLLIGIGAIGLGVLLFALLHKDKNEAPPQPLSPA